MIWNWKTLYIPLILLLLASVVLNVVLLKASKKFYAIYKLQAAFPSNINRFAGETIAETERSGKRVVILFGDSRIEQWEPFLEDYDDFLFINRGIGGETTEQLKLRFEQDVLGHAPDIVVIQVGINDLTTLGVAPQQAEEIKTQAEDNIREIVDALLDRNTKVILTTIIPPAKPSLARQVVWDESIEAAVQDINQRLSTTYNRTYNNKNLVILNTQAALQHDDGSWKKGVNKDTLHLTAAGYREMNAALADHLKIFD